MKAIVTLGVLAILLTVTNAVPNVLMCYYGSWAYYKPGIGKVTLEELKKADKCTHIIYSFTGLEENGQIQIKDKYLEIELKSLENLSKLKKSNPKLKIMVAIGGWNVGSAPFSKVAANKNLRKTFVKSVVEFMKKYKLDGFDLDWEYPASRSGSSPADKKNFITLIKELKDAFEANKNGWILTAAVGATKSRRAQSYDVKKMTKYLDFINVMAYDLHNYEGGKTAFNAPLYAAPSEEGQELNVYDIMQGWIKDGAKPEKLVMGLAFYGKSYTLASPSNQGVGAVTTGAGNAGTFTQEPGILSYLEICQNIKNNGWSYKFDDKQKVPYAYHGNQWVGYDDVKSIKMKVDVAKQLKLGGVMMWSIEMDDITNACGGGSFPLLNAISDSLKGKKDQNSVVKPNVKVTTKNPWNSENRNKKPVVVTTPSSKNNNNNSGNIMCHGNGLQRGTLFDQISHRCKHEYNVKC